MYPSEMPYFNTENPVVRDELWNDNEYEPDEEYFYLNVHWYHGDEPDWDSMRGGHDDFESDYY